MIPAREDTRPASKKGRRSGATSAVAFPERLRRMPHTCRPDGVPRSP